MNSLSKLFFTGATLCFAFTAIDAHAALPPFYQSVKEYKALLSSPELANELGSAAMVRDIQRNDEGFVVTSQQQTLVVDVVYDPISKPGPAKFHLVFHPVTPLQDKEVQ